MPANGVKLTMMVAVFLCLGLPLMGDTTMTLESARLATSSEQLKRESREFLAVASELAAAKREEYKRVLSRKVQDLQPRIDELKKKAKAASGDLREDLLKQLELTELNRDRLRQNLDKMTSNSEEAWEDVKAGMDSALEDIQKALEKARSRFR